MEIFSKIFELYYFNIFLNVGSRLNRVAFNDMKKNLYVDTIFIHRNWVEIY